MSSGALGGSLRHLRELFQDGTVIGLGDGQLLARYARSNDEAAFEALVARHGPMVLATCRAVLKHEHDIEDAFQATFLVLSRKVPHGSRRRRAGRLAAPRRVSRGGAGERRLAAEAAPRGGGRGHGRARGNRHGARSRSRVDRARGGQPAARSASAAGGPLRPGGPDLRAGGRAAELDRADAAAPAGPGAASIAGTADPPRHHGGSGRGRPGRSDDRGAGAVPAALARSAVAAAAGGTISATAAALSADIIRSLFLTKLRIAFAGLAAVAAAVLATAGAAAVGSGRPDPSPAAMPSQAGGEMKRPPAAKEAATPAPASAEVIEVHGRVVDEFGRPVAGAAVRVVHRVGFTEPAPETTSGPSGRFTLRIPPPWSREDPRSHAGRSVPLGGRVGPGVRARLGLGRTAARRPGRDDDRTRGGPGDRGSDRQPRGPPRRQRPDRGR